MLPIIALLGRPNVGKSSLFNRLVRQNKSITHDLPGVTRDRIYGEVHGEVPGERGGENAGEDVRYALIDTGGMLPDASEFEGGGMDRHVFEQATEALCEADAVLFVVDGRDGMTGLDQAVSEKIRSSGKPILLVVNKVDGPEQEAKATADFHALGLEIAVVSAAHGYGLHTLRQRILELAKPFVQPARVDGPELGLKLCMLGRPNAGKSSLVNALVGEARQIVSEIAGTTRDSVDVGFEKDGKRYTFVDTAGVRRRAVITDHLEKLSVYRALSSSKRADVTILVLDAVEGLSHQDKRLIAYLAEQRTPFIVAVNKMDLVPRHQLEEVKAAYEEALRICAYVPVLHISALKGTNLHKILPLAEEIARECVIRIGTGALNRAMSEATTKHQPPVIKRRRAKFYYLTQAEETPPMFVFFVNDAELVPEAYGRYLEAQLRKLLGIKKAPLAAVFRSSHEKKEAERPGKARAPRLGKDRRDMERAEVEAKAAHTAMKAKAGGRKPGGKAGSKPASGPGKAAGPSARRNSGPKKG